MKVTKDDTFHYLPTLNKHLGELKESLEKNSKKKEKLELLEKTSQILAPLLNWYCSPEKEIDLDVIICITKKLSELYDSNNECVGLIEGIVGLLLYFIEEMKGKKCKYLNGKLN
ncbi:MAG: hypothetical protein LBQ13_02080 [Endomicrobium sp.]|jgi:hypothetical protein|nr:hypothetical protein [Endomicrobium sp.]